VHILPHHTGHEVARDGRLLRVDLIAGRWVATRYGPGMTISDTVYGTDEQVYAAVERWRIT
jgi:hypothetical protein